MLHVWYVPGFVVPIHFVKRFCIYVHEWGWVVIFFFNFFVLPDLVLPSKWGQFHKMSWGFFPPLHFLLRVYINWNHWFLKYLIELPFQIIWFYCFPYEKIFNHWSISLMVNRTASSWISYDKLYFFLVFYSFNRGLQIYWHPCFIHSIINLISVSSFYF